MTAPGSYASTFVVISGIPGSGKSTVGRALANALFWPAIDKDEFLEGLLRRESEVDAMRRRFLSRKSDDLFRDAARRERQAVLISFWHVTGMPIDSGTPTEWVARAADRVAHLHCQCDPAVAARRFADRTRHAGHGDSSRSVEQLTEEFARLAALGPPDFGGPITVETERPLDIPGLSGRIHESLRAPLPQRPPGG